MTQEANPGLVFLERVRLSFPHLAAPHASAQGAEPKYSADFIVEPTSPGYAKFMAQVQAKALEKFGAQTDAILQFIGGDRKQRCYGAGEEVINTQTMQPYDGYPGHVYIKANNAVQPAMFDAAGPQLLDARTFYGGCYVNVQIQPWIQDNRHGRAVRCELVGIQFHSDGEAFGVAPVDPATLFGAVPGAPAAIAPGVAPAVPGAAAPAPGGVYQVPPQNLPGAAQPAAPGGYDPAAYQAPPAQAPQPAAPAPVVPGQPPALDPALAQGVPGVVQPMAPPPGVAPAVAPGINPATGLPY